MDIQDIVSALSLRVAAGADHLKNEVSGGYASDLLSCVMAGAKAGNVWITLQAHANVVAVADLLSLAGVIVTENTQLAAEMLERANEKGIPILVSAASTFVVAGQLYSLDIGKVD